MTHTGLRAMNMPRALVILGASMLLGATGSASAALSLPPIKPPTITVPSIISAPAITTPAITVPPIRTPAISTPPIKTPVITIPSVRVPSVGTPAVSVPSVSTPAAHVPSSSGPVGVPGISSSGLGSISHPLSSGGGSARAHPSAPEHGSSRPTASGSGLARSPAAASATRSARTGRAPVKPGLAKASGGAAGSTTGARPGTGLSSSAAARAAGSQSAGVPGAKLALSPATLDASHRPRAAAHGSSNPLDAIGRHIPLPLPIPDWSKPIILVLLLVALGLAVRARRAALRVRRLERQRVGLMDDLSSMQGALVPDVPAQLGSLEVTAAYRPADGPAAGGDFYDAFTLARGRVALILGDVSGHGRDALHRAAMMRYTLRAYVQAGLSPRAALRLAGDVLADATGEQFTTVAVAVYDSQHATLTFAAAGHPPPIVLGGEGYQPIAACSSPPIGWGIPTGRRQTTISLPAGALACFFTDGLPEAHAPGGMLGREGIITLLASLSPAPTAAALLGGVRAAVQEVTDDMAACMITAHTAGAQPFTRLEELELDAPQLDGTLAERFLRACHVPAAQVQQAIAQAREIAAHTGGALLGVELAPTGASVTVMAADRSTPLAARSADEPASLALVS